MTESTYEIEILPAKKGVSYTINEDGSITETWYPVCDATGIVEFEYKKVEE